MSETQEAFRYRAIPTPWWQLVRMAKKQEVFEEFIETSRDYVLGTQMAHSGLKNPDDRTALNGQILEFLLDYVAEGSEDDAASN